MMMGLLNSMEELEENERRMGKMELGMVRKARRDVADFLLL